MAAIFLARFAFESGMVSNISLLSEQIPTERAKVLTIGSAAITAGVAAGNLVGPTLFSTWRVQAIGLISAAGAFLAVIILLRWVREGVE